MRHKACQQNLHFEISPFNQQCHNRPTHLWGIKCAADRCYIVIEIKDLFKELNTPLITDSHTSGGTPVSMSEAA